MEGQIDNLGKVSITVDKEYWNINKDYDKLVVVERQSTNISYISRKPVPAGTSIDNREYWIKFSASNLTPYGISQEFGDDEEVSISQKILTEAFDGEDVAIEDNKIKFADKNYNTESFSGLGRIYLRKSDEQSNVLTQSMMNKSNTIYIIQYDYDLDESTINIPANCVLKFEGGSLSNGVLNGSNTSIVSAPVQIFSGIIFDGSWDVENAYPEWFNSIDNACKYFKKVVLIGQYELDSLNIASDYAITELCGIGNTESVITFADDGIAAAKTIYYHDFGIRTALNSQARTFGTGIKIKGGIVERVRIYTFKRGIELDTEFVVVNVRINDCIITYQREYGICSIASNSHQHNGVTICKNYIVGVGSSTYDINNTDQAKSDTEIGILVDGGLSTCISNNIVEYCNGPGIKVKSSSYTIEGLVFLNNYSENNKYCGFFFERTTSPISRVYAAGNRGTLNHEYDGGLGVRDIYHNLKFSELEENYFSDKESYYKNRSLKRNENLFPYDLFSNIKNGFLMPYIVNGNLKATKGDFPNMANVLFYLDTNYDYMAEVNIAINENNIIRQIAFYSYRESDGTVVGLGSRGFKNIGSNFLPLTGLGNTNGKCYCSFTDSNDGTVYFKYIRIYRIPKAINIAVYNNTLPNNIGDDTFCSFNGKLVHRYNGNWLECDNEEANIRRSGTFAQRPTPANSGFVYFCKSGASIDGGNTEKNNIPIYWTGSGWVDANGTSVVAVS